MGPCFDQLDRLSIDYLFHLHLFHILCPRKSCFMKKLFGIFCSSYYVGGSIFYFSRGPMRRAPRQEAEHPAHVVAFLLRYRLHLAPLIGSKTKPIPRVRLATTRQQPPRPKHRTRTRTRTRTTNERTKAPSNLPLLVRAHRTRTWSNLFKPAPSPFGRLVFPPCSNPASYLPTFNASFCWTAY